MCYPIQEQSPDSPFRSCSHASDCKDLQPQEGGDGECFRHHDRRKVHVGICLSERETKSCWKHEDCAANQRCTNGYCGERQYFEAIQKMTCTSNEMCKTVLTGDLCCIDLSGSLDGWNSAKANWDKSCCTTDSDYPLIRPPANITDDQLKKIDNTIGNMKAFQMDAPVCLGLEYSMMQKLENCQDF